MKTEQPTKIKRRRIALHSKISKAPDPIFEPDYTATKKDLINLATKLDISELKGEMTVLKKEIETILGLGKLLLIIITIGFVGLGLLIKL